MPSGILLLLFKYTVL